MLGAHPAEAPHPNPSPEGEGRDRAHLADLAEQAARLAKADLTTGMVGEFPELQGLMGGYYARAEGLPDVVADAIRDHYKPVGQGDEVPTALVTVAVSLADKLDTLSGFFAEAEAPTGSRDPYALRRAALGLINLVVDNRLHLPLLEALIYAQGLRFHEVTKGDFFEFSQAMRDAFYGSNKSSLDGLGTVVIAMRVWDVMDFFADRLKVQQREAGVRHDLIDAVFALGGEDDLGRLLARGKGLPAFFGPDGGGNPLAGGMAALASLRAPIDGFFEDVTVNDADPEKRAFRLALLVRVRDAVHRVADFSRIEG